MQKQKKPRVHRRFKKPDDKSYVKLKPVKITKGKQLSLTTEVCIKDFASVRELLKTDKDKIIKLVSLNLENHHCGLIDLYKINWIK